MLNFRKARPEENQLIKALTGSTPEGAVCFAFLESSGDNFYESFLLGEENGVTESIIFDTGDEYFLVYGQEFPALLTRSEKTVMIYEKKEALKGTAESIEGVKLQEIYKLMSAKNSLSFDDERRYVLRLRAVNAGFSAVFGIENDGELVSCAAVSSMNDKYGLIGDVFTKKSERGRGYAADCLMTATEFILRNGRIPMLLCDEKMCPYYEKSGFRIYGKM